MNDVLSFFGWLLIELPARVLLFFQVSPVWAMAVGVILVLMLLMVLRRGQRRKR